MRGGAVPGAARGAARRGGGWGRGVRGGGGRGVQPRLHRAPPPPHLPGERPVERRHGGVPPRHLPAPPRPAARQRGVPGAGHFTTLICCSEFFCKYKKIDFKKYFNECLNGFY